jgi:uncharacterized coiled-coil DUF342 family protein
MKEFCHECARLESELEIVRSQSHSEIERLKKELADARAYASAVHRENDKLALDLAFYNKDVILPCNQK